LITKTDTEHLTIAGGNEALRHEGAAHLDVAPCDIVLQELQYAPAIAGSAATKMRVQRLGVVEARDFDDVGVVDGVVAGQRISSRRCGGRPPLRRSPAQDRGFPAQS